jgi:predicted ATP-grasp superfamily ATP-dependent carboligase
MSKIIPAIILSAQTMALGVVRALGQQGVPLVVVHYSACDIAQHSRYATEALLTPDPQQDEEGFIDRIMQLAPKWEGAVIIPVSDETLLVAARHKEKLSRHFRVACPDYATVCQVVDKRLTYPLAAATGVKIPHTLIPHSLAELQSFCNEDLFPCLLKPAQSHLFHACFDTKMFFVETPAQLLDGYHRAAKAGLEIMIQEYIPGGDKEGANYNCYAVGGKTLVEFTADHVRSAPPCFGSPRVVRSRQINELLEPGRRLIQALNYSGYACIEFKRDTRDGEYTLMEVNGRHNLSTLLAVSCGINFPWLEYRHRAYGELPQAQIFKSGVYWIDMTRDIAYSLKHHRDERYAWSDYFKPYLNEHVWAICSGRDPLPFLQRVGHLAGELLKGKMRPGGPGKGAIDPLLALPHYTNK